MKPKTAQVGDPLTVTAEISGRGNFDAVTAPTLESDRGWHTYPPGSNFKPDDDIGISGTKTFEMVLTPNEAKKAVPPLVFSYFDPLKESYVTLKGDRLPVVVEGGPLATATPAIASASTTPPAAAASPTAAPQAQDILYQLTDHGRWGQSFTPVFMQPDFWAVQAVPFLGLIGFFGWEMRKRRLENREGQRRAAWEHETAELATQAAPGRRSARPIFCRGFARGAVENRSRLRRSAALNPISSTQKRRSRPSICRMKSAIACANFSGGATSCVTAAGKTATARSRKKRDAKCWNSSTV